MFFFLYFCHFRTRLLCQIQIHKLLNNISSTHRRVSSLNFISNFISVHHSQGYRVMKFGIVSLYIKCFHNRIYRRIFTTANMFANVTKFSIVSLQTSLNSAQFHCIMTIISSIIGRTKALGPRGQRASNVLIFYQSEFIVVFTSTNTVPKIFGGHHATNPVDIERSHTSERSIAQHYCNLWIGNRLIYRVPRKKQYKTM